MGGRRAGRKWKIAATAVCACFVCMVGLLNISPAFAESMQGIPVLGSVSKVLTFRSYENVGPDGSIHADTPQIQSDSALAQQVNEQIRLVVERHIAEAEAHIAEYKEAFLSTGGTEEEFKAKNLHANVTYSVKHESEELLSFVVTSTEDWYNAGQVDYFYNLDLKKDQPITLKDLLGEDYVRRANESIAEQIAERTQADANATYFAAADGGFTTITEDANFYINQNGNPVVVFEKYEIAPGFMGIQEFEIKR